MCALVLSAFVINLSIFIFIFCFCVFMQFLFDSLIFLQQNGHFGDSKVVQFPFKICIMHLLCMQRIIRSNFVLFLQGRFEIICLSGSYLLTDSSGARNRSGGLSVSLASPDGRVIGGGVGGILIAASPVQVAYCFLELLDIIMRTCNSYSSWTAS